MSVATDNKKILKGGEFVISESNAQETFTPEDLNEEQRLFGSSLAEFITAKIHPNVAKIDKGAHDLVVQYLEELGELGYLGTSFPEKFGGLDLDLNTETLISENMGTTFSFGVAFAAHTGIGSLPILYYGNETQKKKYLPGLAIGKLKAAYCLTEPGSGSDALAAKTKAVLSSDGKQYILNGQKMWITNSGFADLFIVFAKIDGEKFTGFIVEKGTPGLRLGAEEDKLGIKGSSTRQVFFEDLKIPVENLLGEVGKGHKIAFNVLNIGRYKLCAMTLGGAKHAATTAIKYANDRIQFKVPISSFGAIQHKLAEMAVKIYATESATYRVSGLINDKVEALVAKGMLKYEAKLAAAEEYSIECAILKVLGSETVDFVVDEAVQVFGGMGFSEEAPVARAYRDARINRIFEGTNEINRLLSIGQLIKKAMKGELDLMTPALAIQKELMSVPDFSAPQDGFFASEKMAAKTAKKSILMIAGAAVQKFQADLEKQQEIIMCLADMLLELFTAESALLRTEKLVTSKNEPEEAALYIDLARVYFSDALEKINLHGKHAIIAFNEGDPLRVMLMALKRFTKYEPFDTIGARKRIAAKLIEENKYAF